MKKTFLFLAVLVLLIGGAEVFSQTNPASPSEQALHPSKPAPVIVDGKILFYIKTGLLSFTAQDRAQTVAKAIKR